MLKSLLITTTLIASIAAPAKANTFINPYRVCIENSRNMYKMQARMNEATVIAMNAGMLNESTIESFKIFTEVMEAFETICESQDNRSPVLKNMRTQLYVDVATQAELNFIENY